MRTKIVAHTALTRAIDIQKYTDEGMAEVFPKPTPTKRLVKYLRANLDE